MRQDVACHQFIEQLEDEETWPQILEYQLASIIMLIFYVHQLEEILISSHLSWDVFEYDTQILFRRIMQDVMIRLNYCPRYYFRYHEYARLVLFLLRGQV